jgi:hypothetical protein
MEKSTFQNQIAMPILTPELGSGNSNEYGSIRIRNPNLDYILSFSYTK